ncbi:ubiquitin-conjugating enzyme E2 R2-like [Rattus rattus]|uniref:ubiquitin-conjugating enzyme E2 R2-like n=1 Tax=Rattus rattus TaxID=10117 RepID=UPI0013F38E0B|nr:ubiquitin-conjugating enzyme E2 R2-like [Rattus rattus]
MVWIITYVNLFSKIDIYLISKLPEVCQHMCCTGVYHNRVPDVGAIFLDHIAPYKECYFGLQFVGAQSIVLVRKDSGRTERHIFFLFQAHIKFPIDYPYSPPTFRFLTKMWHPNIYENGDVCISILHLPVDDPQSGELPSERWNPPQNVRTIVLSVISLLNEPNTFSPANVDASVMFRKWRDSKGKDQEYAEIIR